MFFMYKSCVSPLNRIHHFLERHKNTQRNVLMPLSFNNAFISFISFFHSNLVKELKVGAPKSLQMVIAAMKLKDAYSLEGKL